MKTKFKTLTKSQKESVIENRNFLNNQNYITTFQIKNKDLSYIKNNLDKFHSLHLGINKIEIFKNKKSFFSFMYFSFQKKKLYKTSLLFDKKYFRINYKIFNDNKYYLINLGLQKK